MIRQGLTGSNLSLGQEQPGAGSQPSQQASQQSQPPTQPRGGEYLQPPARRRVAQNDLVSFLLHDDPISPSVSSESKTTSTSADKRDNSEITYRTRAGELKTFITKHETCRPFGFYPGQRVMTPRGPAWVIGVNGGELYWHIDGDAGASKWTGHREADFLRAKFYVLYNPCPVFKSTASMEFGALINNRLYSDVVFLLECPEYMMNDFACLTENNEQFVKDFGHSQPLDDSNNGLAMNSVQHPFTPAGARALAPELNQWMTDDLARANVGKPPIPPKKASVVTIGSGSSVRGLDEDSEIDLFDQRSQHQQLQAAGLKELCASTEPQQPPVSVVRVTPGRNGQPACIIRTGPDMPTVKRSALSPIYNHDASQNALPANTILNPGTGTGTTTAPAANAGQMAQTSCASGCASANMPNPAPASSSTLACGQNQVENNTSFANACAAKDLSRGEQPVARRIPIYGHKAILSTRSEYFRAMFATPTIEQQQMQIHIDGVDYRTFLAMIKFIYTNKVEVKSLDAAAYLLFAAEMFLLDNLREYCARVLAQRISESEVLPILALAERFKLSQLKQTCIRYALDQMDSATLQSELEIFVKSGNSTLVCELIIQAALQARKRIRTDSP